MSEPDRRRDVERTLAGTRSAACPLPHARRRDVGDRVDELTDEQVDLDGVARMWRMARALEFDQACPSTQRLRQSVARGAADDSVPGALDDQARALDPIDDGRDVASRVA